MRDMADEYKMTLRTLWDANDYLKEIEARAARDQKSWQVHREDGGKKKPTRAAIVTAALFHLRSLDADSQIAAIRAGMADLNDLILGREKTKVVAPQASPPPGGESKSTRAGTKRA